MSQKEHIIPEPTNWSLCNETLHPIRDTQGWIEYGNNTNNHDAVGVSFNDIVGIWLTGAFCLAGLIGNVLSVIVITRAHSRSPMFYVLRAVALSDFTFLLTVFIIQTVVNLHTHVNGLHWFYYNRGYIQCIVWPLLMFTQMSTVWLTVLVSVERYIAICHVLQAASICTISKVRQAVILIFALSAVYNLPRFFEFTVTKNSLMKSPLGNHVLYRYLYTCILYALLLFIIPLILLVFLNAKLVLALQQGKKNWETLQLRQKKEQNLTVIPLTIVLIFFLCGTPSLVVNIIDSISPDIASSEVYMKCMLVANLLVVLNSAANFIIYCLLGRKFRSNLAEMCGCGPRRNYHMVSLTQTTDANERGNYACTSA